MGRKQGELGMHLRMESDDFCFVKLDKELNNFASRFLLQLIIQRQTNISNQGLALRFMKFLRMCMCGIIAAII